MYEKNRKTTACGKKGRVVALVIVFIMLVAGAQSLFASEKTPVEKVTIVPSFAIRHIDGSSVGSKDRTGFGPGLEVAYDRIISPDVSVGLSLSTEHFFFKDYFRYTDVKVAANVKMRVVPVVNKDSKINLFFCFGVGADFVFRSDADFATYFMVHPGLQLNVATKEGRDFVVNFWSALSVKDKQLVFSGSVGIGLAFSFGEPDRAKDSDKGHGPDAVVAPAVEPVAESAADVELPPIVIPEVQPEEPAAEPEAEPAVEPEAEPVIEVVVVEPEAEAGVEVVVVEPAAEAGVEIVVVEPEKPAVTEVAMRPFHTEEISYVSDTVEVDEVYTYMVGDVEIEKHRIYTKDIVVTKTVVVWD